MSRTPWPERRCLLCGGASRELATIDAMRVVAEWRGAFGIDIAPELAGVAEVLELECPDCDFTFFSPQVVGSPAMYEQLQEVKGYYQSERWEHALAMHDLERGSRLLEVGCGVGGFLERAEAERGVVAVGSETNAAAA